MTTNGTIYQPIDADRIRLPRSITPSADLRRPPRRRVAEDGELGYQKVTMTETIVQAKRASALSLAIW